mgnify:CR=1 FL=1
MSIFKGHLLGNVGFLNFKEVGETKIMELSVATKRWERGGETSQWNKVVAFGKTAEYLNDRATKGDVVFADGDIILENYEAKDGSKKVSVHLRAKQVNLISRNKANKEEESDKHKTSEVTSNSDFTTDDIPF